MPWLTILKPSLLPDFYNKKTQKFISSLHLIIHDKKLSFGCIPKQNLLRFYIAQKSITPQVYNIIQLKSTIFFYILCFVSPTRYILYLIQMKYQKSSDLFIPFRTIEYQKIHFRFLIFSTISQITGYIKIIKDKRRHIFF